MTQFSSWLLWGRCSVHGDGGGDEGDGAGGFVGGDGGGVTKGDEG